MKVLLLFPPQWVPYQPHLALPSLTAFLRSNGIDAVQKDLNVDSYDHFLSRKFLRSLKPAIDFRFAELDRKPSLAAGLEQRLYADLFLAKSSLFRIADEIEDAKSVFRSPRYYDATALSRARETFENALSVTSIAHFPTRLELMSFAMPSYDGTFESLEKLTVNQVENPYLEYFENHVLPYVREQSPGVIGISIAGESQLIPALSLCRLIKKDFNCHIVLGGYVITLLTDSLARHRNMFGEYCDSLMVLEGERPLLELVRCIENGQSLESVPNLIYFDGEGVKQTPTIIPEAMESLPVPDFDGLPLNKYLAPEPVLPVLASRGCYWGKCAFCSHNVSYENKYRISSGEKIVAYLEILHRKYGVNHFAFSDEAIAPKMMRDLTSRLIEHQDELNLSTNIRLEPQFTLELCRSMHEAGFRVVYLGLESGCDRVLGLMKKGFTTETALKVCRNLVEAGIWDHLYVFLGFPGESETEARETFEFLSENSGIIRSFNIGSFSLGRGSNVMNSPLEYGVEVTSTKPGDLALIYPHSASPGISKQQAEELSAAGWHKLSKEYPTGNVMESLSKEDLLLYLAHFASTDPVLRKISRAQQNTILLVNLTPGSKPRMAANIIRTTLNFDLPSILNMMASNQQADANPVLTRVLFNLDSRKMRSVGPNVFELLEFLDRGLTVRLIARQLAKKHGAPEAAVEAFCLDSLNQLAREGYVAG
jgi:anaerobic magnesium-protoporphyrin IX monomethyl ester cyclase